MPLAGAVTVDGETLRAGDSPRTVAGTLKSLDNKDNLALNPTDQALPTPLPQTVGILVDGQTTEIDGQAFEVLSDGVSTAGTTLVPGGPAAIVSGTGISLGRKALMADRSTIPVSLASPSPFTTVIGGQVITAAPSSVILQGTSLEPRRLWHDHRQHPHLPQQSRLTYPRFQHQRSRWHKSDHSNR